MHTMSSLFQAGFYRLAFAVCAAIVIGGQRSEADGVHPSVWVYPSSDGDLLYATDVSGVRINDFSECGYKRSLPVESDGAWFYFVSPNESRRFYRLAY
jgi:hypothetical protein